MTFASGRTGRLQIYWMSADGSEEAEPLFSWSPDGQNMTFAEFHPVSGYDVWVFNRESRDARPILNKDYYEGGAVFSPDGRFLAYVSDETGKRQIYVRAYPGPGTKLQVSTDGGDQPVWPRRSNEIFYREGNKIMSVMVRTNPVLRADKPRLVLTLETELGADIHEDSCCPELA